VLVTAIRHAESLGNAGLSSDSDPPLSPKGEAQARLTARRLAADGVTQVWSSPYRRALMTAECVARWARIEVVIRPDMCEHHVYEDLKDFRFRSAREIKREFPFARVAGGFGDGWEPEWPETWEHLLERTARVAADALVLGRSFWGDAHLVVVGHGASVKGLLRALSGEDIPQDAPYVNACVSRVTLGDSLPGRALFLNDSGHLAGLGEP
jgi:broad specificity phosphatase PhoE